MGRIEANISEERNGAYHNDPVKDSMAALSRYVTHDKDLVRELLARGKDIPTAMIMGEIPLISAHDHRLFPKGTRLIKVPADIKETIHKSEMKDITDWNSPKLFLERLQATKFHPVNPEVKSPTMERLKTEGHVISFDDLRVSSPSAEGKPRMSRSKEAYNGLLSVSIMGRGRMPLMLGAVPDVASRESYKKAAMAGVMVTASRDKIWGEPKNQAALVRAVINDLRNFSVPNEMQPNLEELKEFWKITKNSSDAFDESSAHDLYEKELKNSWIANVGAAIETSDRAIDRGNLLYEAGCRMFRIYSPEGGHEIVETVNKLRKIPNYEKGSVNIIAGQIMDGITAKAAVDAGCDAIIIGVAGGSQCTTSINADIPVNTPLLLDDLRQRNLGVPIGIEGGGVGSHMMTAIALGATFFSKPGEIGVSLAGTGDYVFEDPAGQWHVLYGGEASNSAKTWRENSFDSQGRIRFPEGEGGVRVLSKNNGPFDPDDLEDRRSLVRNIERLVFADSVGLVFQRIPTIDDVHTQGPSGVVSVSQNASDLSHPYAR